MIRRTASLLVFAIFLFQAVAFAEVPPQISAETAVLMTAGTQEILFAKDPNKKMYPASTTKMVTLLVALERGNLDDVVTVSSRVVNHDPNDESLLGLKAGDKLTLRELLTGMMLVSGNDAAEAVAEHIAGSVPAFVRLMNAKAAEMGLVHTHFSNPHGMPDPANHYSTALDLARFAAEGLLNPEFARIVSTREYTVKFLNRAPLTVTSTNKMFKTYPGTIGVKTGSTQASGDCLVAAAKRDNMKLITVVLNDDYRWEDAASLFDYGFRQIKTANLR